jgi:hypothetical protein
MKNIVVLTIVVGALGITSAASAQTSPLAGAFQATLKGNVSVLNGTWLLNVARNGAYTITKKPATTQVLISGVSTVSGHTFTVVDKSGPLSCKGSQARATYTFTLTGKTLTFKVMTDPCVGRKTVLASSHFTKVS